MNNQEAEAKLVKPQMRLKSMDHLMAEKKPKKKRPKKSEYAEQINEENRKAEDEDDDQTSESSEDSTSSSDEETVRLKKSSRLEVIVREEDFELNETLTFTNDVYNFTICANMTKCCSPLQQGFALKQCFIVFSV